MTEYCLLRDCFVSGDGVVRRIVGSEEPCHCSRPCNFCMPCRGPVLRFGPLYGVFAIDSARTRACARGLMVCGRVQWAVSRGIVGCLPDHGAMNGDSASRPMCSDCLEVRYCPMRGTSGCVLHILRPPTCLSWMPIDCTTSIVTA